MSESNDNDRFCRDRTEVEEYEARLRLNELSKRCCKCSCRAAVKLSQARTRRNVRLWHDGPGRLEARRYVVDAVDADEAIDGCSEPRLWRLQLNITRQGFVGGYGTSRGGGATCCTPSTREEALWKIQVPGGARLLQRRVVWCTWSKAL